MSFFSSKRERWLWIAVVIVLVGIYATLDQAPAIVEALGIRLVTSVGDGLFFVLFISLLVIPVFFIEKRPGRAEIAAGVGIFAVYMMGWLRIGSLEARTHLFEYGLVAALIHEALLERQSNGRRVPVPTLLALVISIALGWLDEGIQSLLPNRVYDIIDIVFNTLAATMIIGARWVLMQVRRWAQRRRNDM